MKVTVLGSGTLLPSAARRSPAHLVECGGARILLDCGAGTVHGLATHRVPWRELTHVALTHFHTDHTGDLAALLFALRHGGRARERGLVLLGPPGLAWRLERLADAHGAFVREPGFPLEVVELSGEDRWPDPAGRFLLRCHPTPHTPESLAYRIEAGAAMGYTGDTGPSEPLGRFFRGVGVLLAECSLADPPSLDTHLSPRSLADLAGLAAPDLLLVTHVYPPLRPAAVPELLRAAGFTGRALAARDGTAVRLEQGRTVRLRPRKPRRER